ncbi:MAG: DegV family protein [Roseburia sp.]|nr:DegV family protein [Ruminococcus sp.]MCM1156570.1 DegV family protein [Roseburia sp.]MCM1243829.1 DegV family protein [Roseburia sp.]
MSYKIIVDSCCELPEMYHQDKRFQIIPLGLEVGDYQIMDDKNFNQAEFLAQVALCPVCPKSSCPSPEKYMEAYRADVDNIFVVTLSSHLSGSYNSAVLGKNLYHEQYGTKNIYVFDSESASSGETQYALKMMELQEKGASFEETIQELETFRDEMKTYFILDNLETLRKNGRLTGVKAMVVSTLNIKPIMFGNHGVIEQKSQAIGMKKALSKLADIMVKEVGNMESRTLMISHCNCPDRAEFMKRELLARTKVKDIIVMDTAGVSSMYANDGGIVVTI